MKPRCPQSLFARLTPVTLSLCVLLTLFGTAVPPAAGETPIVRTHYSCLPFRRHHRCLRGWVKATQEFRLRVGHRLRIHPPGPQKVQIALVGQGIGASAVNQTLTATPGAAYTVAAIGAIASSLSLEVFVDNNLAAPGSAKLRVYQLSPNAGAISVATGGNTPVSVIGNPQASDYLSLSADSYSFDVNAPTGQHHAPALDDPQSKHGHEHLHRGDVQWYSQTRAGAHARKCSTRCAWHGKRSKRTATPERATADSRGL